MKTSWLEVIGLRQADNENHKSFQIGGDQKSEVLLVPNYAQIQRLLLEGDLATQAQPKVFIDERKESPGQEGAELILFEVTLTENGKDIDPGKERRKLGSVALADVPQGEVELPDVVAAINAAMESGNTNTAFLIAMEGDGQLRVSNDDKKRASLMVGVADYEPAELFSFPVRPKPGVYTTIKDGNLYYDGKPLRLWGVVGAPDAGRLTRMGFNAERTINPRMEIVFSKEFSNYKKGDGSRIDQIDRHFADLKENGLFVMFATLSAIPTGLIYHEDFVKDDSPVAGGEGWEEWQQTMRDLGKEHNSRYQHYLYVDERWQQLKKLHARLVLTHVNQYTGKAYGEEENIAIYEVFNENAFAYHALSNGFEKWAPYFRNKLQEKWNAWLRNKYKDDAGLRDGWSQVASGESLEQNSVDLSPIMAQRADYPVERGNDFVQFITELADTFHQEFRDYCRSLFPEGVGVNVVPFSFDTLYRPNLQWSYNQSLGDVNSIGMYFWNLDSTLAKPPDAYVIDTYTVADKPTVLYETNHSRPSPIRAEFPYKLAALSSFQNWDGAFWHYWGPWGSQGPKDLGYLTGTLMPPDRGHYWNAVHHSLDPVMCSAMAMAGQIFIHGLLEPAADPAVIDIGGEALFSYSSFRGVDIREETFQRGSKLRFKPESESGVLLNEEKLPPRARIEKAVASGDYIKWDWPNERLIIDAPAVKVYVGKITEPFQFSDGITLSDVSTPWVSFSMVRTDGASIAGPGPVGEVLISGVYEARNTGFEFDYSVKGGPLEQSDAVKNRGWEPIVVTPVEYTVSFPTKLKGSLKRYDFALRETSAFAVADSNQIRIEGPTSFMDVLTIEERGEKGTLPLEQPTEIALHVPGETRESTGSAATSSSVPLLPELPWDAEYDTAHQILRDSPLLFSAITANEKSEETKARIELSGAQIDSLHGNLANIEMTFEGRHIETAEVTFTQPPDLQSIAKDFTAILGEPSEQVLGLQYENTRILWKREDAPTEVLITESQGVMKILVKR